MKLQCLHYYAKLEKTSSAVVCPDCKNSWPVEDGIPRFFKPPYYWGELDQQEARSFLHEVRRAGWREAAVRRFMDRPDLLSSIVEKQRIAWFPLLALDTNSVALDIGSGYGAITHALATAVGEVYSLEAIAERIEFARLRLLQDGISNVRQIQGTALNLPFCNETFDLVVVNGVLEWLGEWDQNGNPREVQLKFLRSVGRILKKDGVLVIGIENRFGEAAIRGAIDHSGLRYTSLMPRKLASLCMRYIQRKHHRTILNPRREYRTFTYSEKGYQALLKEAGLGNSSFYWSEPGYNQPYFLVPLQNFALQHYLSWKLSEPAHAWHKTWRRRTRIIVSHSRLVRPTVSEFVILTNFSKDAGYRRKLARQLQDSIPSLCFPAQADFVLSTNGIKQVIKVIDTETKSLELVIKVSPPSGTDEAVRSELRNLEIVNDSLGLQSGGWVRVPTPMGCARIGRCTQSVETAAAGAPFNAILFSKSERQRFRYLLKELPRCIEGAVKISQLLRESKDIRKVDLSSWELPKAFAAETSSSDQWVHHGDYTIENIFLEQSTGIITVIDWEHLARGLPPLYDVFSLLISALPAVSTEEAGISSSFISWDVHFLAAFFSNGTSARLFRSLLTIACGGFQIPETVVCKMFIQFLQLRAGYYHSRGSAHKELHLRFLDLALQNAGDFVI